MSLCVTVDGLGYLHSSTTAPGQCTSYVLMGADEYLKQTFFDIPASGDFAAAWSAGFVLPMALGLVTWAAAKILSPFNHH